MNINNFKEYVDKTILKRGIISLIENNLNQN